MKHILFALSLFIFLVTSGQTLPKSLTKELAKIDGYYVSGDYQEYLKSVNKLSNFYASKTGDEAKKQEGHYLILKGKGLLGMGKPLPEALETINKGLKLISSVDNQSNEHITNLLTVSNSLIEYKYINEAINYYNQAVSISEKAEKTKYESALKATECKLLFAQGQYTQAYTIARSITGYYKEKINPYYEYKDPKTGKVKKKKHSKADFIKIKRDLGNHLNFSAQILLEKGDYKKADSARSVANKWIEQEIGKSDIAYVDNLYLKSLQLFYLEIYDEALKSFLETYSYMSKTKYGYKYEITGEKHFQILSKVMECSWIENQDDEVRGKRNYFYSEIKKYYEKGNVNRARINFLDIRKEIIKTNFAEAKKLLEELVVEDLIPRDHPYYLTYLDLSLETYSKLEELKKAIEAKNKSLTLLKKLYPENCNTFHLANINKAELLVEYSNDFTEAEKIFNTSYKINYLNEYYVTHVDYLKYSNLYAKFLELQENYKDAIVQLESGYNIAERYYDYTKTDRLAIQATLLAKVYFHIGEMKEAEKYNRVCKKVYYITANKKRTSKADYLLFLGDYNLLIGNLKEAEANFKEANDLLSEAEKEKKRRYRKDVDISEFTSLYLAKGEYSKLEQELLKSIKYKEEVYGKNHRVLLNTINNLSDLYIRIGEYTQAGKTSQRALILAKESFGENSLAYMEALILQAKLYAALGNYPEAIKQFTKIIEKQKRFYGSENNIYVAETITELALSELLNGNKSETIYNYLIHAAKVAQEFNQGDISGKVRESPRYAQALKNLAYYHIETDNLDKALELISKAESIFLALDIDKNNENVATIEILKGEIYKKQGNYDAAIKQFESARDKYKNKFSKDHPEYVYALSKLGQIHYIKQDYDKAISILTETTSYYLSFIDNYFTWLSESEKSKFWRKIKSDFEFYNTLAFKFQNNKDGLIQDVYNFTLDTKALLLNSSIQLRQAIVNSNDQVLIDQFNKWIFLREQLTAKLSYTDEQLKAMGEVTKDELEKEITIIEKELSEKSVAFSENNKSRKKKKEQITWESVRDVLKPNEYAVEIIRYRYYDKSFSDSVIYAALIISPETKKTPEVVMFPNGSDLEKRYIKYYRTTTKLGLDDSYSYDYFWKPISEKIPKGATIYFSSEGVFNEINLESLQNKDGKYVLDENNIVLISNSKDLLNQSSSSSTAKLANSATFVGNPAFYDNNITRKDHNNSSLSQTIKQLPGAEQEVRLVNDFLKKKGWDTELYLYEVATEDTIKKIKSPRVLHFATHGFFIEDNLEKDASVNSGLNEQRAVINPLLKSGLLMYHAGEIMETKNVYDFNLESGILTAYEAMNLDLSNTEMVVLSACETGLGDVQIGEGVFGLQRAFIVAGAKSVIMSLFKVSDEVTMQLMDTFYQKWIELGDKRQAFIEAKKEIRKKNPERIYWGAFVMVGNN